MKKVIAIAAAIAVIVIGATTYVILSGNKKAAQPVADNKPEIATVNNKTDDGTPKRGADNIQNIFPKMISDKKIYSEYPDFEEADGSLPNEVILIAPCGAEVNSSHVGVVIRTVSDGWNEGRGNYATIETSSGDISYAHLKDIFVRVGDMIEIGNKIGTAGNTGELPENISCAFGIVK